MLNPWILTVGSSSLPFGTVDSRLVFSSAPDIGAAEVEVDDVVRPRGDGILFGRDYIGGRTITFDIGVHGDDEAHARTLLRDLATAWRADELRDTPGAMASLTSDTGRTIYGRPRRFAASYEYISQGFALVTLDFRATTDLWYGEAESFSVGIVPPTGGGLLAPLADPLTSTASSDRSQGFTIGGEMPVWPVYTVTGPITNPRLEIVNYSTLDFRLSLAYDESLVVDSRPWARTISRGGTSAAGSLTPSSTRLSAAALPPGPHEFVLRGISETGTAAASVTWRTAYSTY